MAPSSPSVWVEIPEPPTQQKPAIKGQPKLRTVNRQQTMLATIYVEELIAADHKVRAIWQLVGRMDLSRFTEPLRTSRGCAGRPGWDPQLWISGWVYAIRDGIR